MTNRIQRAHSPLGIKQPNVSLLMHNRAGIFSVERLMDFLTALGHDVEIRVTPTRKTARPDVCHRRRLSVRHQQVIRSSPTAGSSPRSPLFEP